MAFKTELDRVATLVEARLQTILSPRAATSGSLAEAMRYAALGGGKRLRPFLLIESARIFGVEEADALDTACALECIHCYSLVHDDLPAMDDDDTRRGRPTVHIAYGEATAILVGDALLTLAFEILSGEAADREPAIRVELIALLAKAAGWQGMVLGQALDLSAERETLDADAVAAMQALKTGALFGFACEAGAVLGRADRKDRDALKTYAAALGQAFQLADDLLDAEGTAEVAGKAVAKDARRGKATLVGLLGPDAARTRLADLVRAAEHALHPFGDRAQTLLETARFIAARKA
jgi:farnesyl diphosphate synthase